MNLEQIFLAFEWTAEHRPEYLADIINRPSGSQWGKRKVIQSHDEMGWHLLAALPWRKLERENYVPELHLATCDYFYLKDFPHFPLKGATQAYKLLSDFTDYSSIQMRDGTHGIELVSAQVEPIPTDKAWLILGEARKDKQPVTGQQMIWTAYPGEMTASLKHLKEFDGTLDSLIKAAASGVPIAVKRINV